MIKRLALIEPQAAFPSHPVFRSRWSTLALLSILMVGAALRFTGALNPDSLALMPQILAGVATIGLVFLIARDAFGTAAGLLSALFYGLSAVAAIQSFSIPSNSLAVFYAMLSLYYAILEWNGGRVFHAILSGGFLGIGAALDPHAAPLGALPLIFHLTANHPHRRRRAAIFIGIAAVAYFLTEVPNLLSLAFAWPHVPWETLSREFHWHNLASNLPIGAGWPLALAGLAGWVWMGYRLAAKRDFPLSRVDQPYIFALLWFYGCTFIFGVHFFMRSSSVADAHAAVPLVSIFAGCLLAAYGTHPNENLRRAGVAACAIVSLYSFTYSSAHVNLYRGLSPSESASAWIECNIPRGELIGIARNDFLTPACLRGHHPNYEVLEGGNSETDLMECLAKLDKIKNEARYLVINEVEFGAYQEYGLPASLFENDFYELAHFEQRPSFLGLRFPKPDNAPDDWIGPNASVRIFARKKAAA